MNLQKFTIRLSYAALLLAGFAAWTSADAAEEFYKGKQIRLIVSTGAGGAYDTYARIMARHLPNHIPGQPKIIVQNMPGASGIKATNYVYNAAPKDGTVIISAHSSISSAPLLRPKATKFEVKKLSWIGSVSKDPFVGYIWHTAPIKTYEEAKKVTIKMGGTSVGSAGIDMAIVSNLFFATKFKIVTGYKNSPATKLAMERGEVHGTFANAWSSLKTSKPAWLKEHKVRIIIQHGFQRHPELKDVPLFIDQAKSNADKQALKLLLARQEAAKPYFAPPGIPAERLATLRRAFDATIKDPKFLAAAKAAHIAVEDPMTGDQVAALGADLANTPSAVVKRVRKIFTDFRKKR